MDTFFDIEAQERSRVTKLGAQTQHRVVLRLVPPSASKQSEIMCARDKCVVFHNIGKAISGSTDNEFIISSLSCQACPWSEVCKEIRRRFSTGHFGRGYVTDERSSKSVKAWMVGFVFSF